jgi:hypothetical protein
MRRRFDPVARQVDRRPAEVNIDDAVEFSPRTRRFARAAAAAGRGARPLTRPAPPQSGGGRSASLVTELARCADPSGARRGSRSTRWRARQPTVSLHIADVEKLILC